MARDERRRPVALWALIALTFLIGLSAAISGPMLFAAPDGRLMGLTPDLLSGTPFSSFAIPGVVLFACIGLFGLFVGYGLATRTAWGAPGAVNPFKRYHWAWAASLALAGVLLVWIAVETALLGYVSFLQPVVAIWAALILALAALGSVRRYFREAP